MSTDWTMEPVSTCDDSTPDGVVECWCARIRGRVQGVGYRDACVQAAQAVGVTGWVRNRKDGSVEVQLQGSVDQLLAMRRWLGDGPPLAEVRSIAWQRAEAEMPPAATFERRPTA